MGKESCMIDSKERIVSNAWITLPSSREHVVQQFRLRSGREFFCGCKARNVDFSISLKRWIQFVAQSFSFCPRIGATLACIVLLGPSYALAKRVRLSLTRLRSYTERAPLMALLPRLLRKRTLSCPSYY
jgi:hypothetical protein